MFRELENAKKDKIAGRGIRKIAKGKGSRKAATDNALLEPRASSTCRAATYHLRVL
jgi:hypothetical protein